MIMQCQIVSQLSSEFTADPPAISRLIDAGV